MRVSPPVSPLFRLLRPDGDAAAVSAQSGNTALRLAIARAGRQCLDCDMMATEVTRERHDAPLDLLDPLGEFALIGRLASDGDTGLVAADHGAMAAITCLRTTRGLPGDAPRRGATHVEAALAQPVLNRILAAWADAAESGGDGAKSLIGGYRAAGRVASLRGLLMSLPVKALAVYRIGLEFDGAAPGTLVFGFPLQRAAAKGAEDRTAGRPADPRRWQRRFAAECRMAPTGLNAVLYRRRMPLAELRALRPGQILPVPASALGDLRLVGAGGTVVGTARLGQLNGARAVRLVQPGMPQGDRGSVPPVEGADRGDGPEPATGTGLEGRFEDRGPLPAEAPARPVAAQDGTPQPG